MTEIVKDMLFTRQLGFFNPSEHTDAAVTFVGVGGIGSFAAFATAKLGVPAITLIDPDKVEIQNAPNQMHPVTQLGEYKVDVTKQMIADHMAETVDVTAHATYHNNELTGDYQGIVVSGLDSMDARKELWEDKLKYNIHVPLYIDARIAGQLILIYAFCPYMPDQIEEYEKTLHSDADAVEATCTERGLIDVGFQCGALITRMVRRHFTGQTVQNCTYVSQKSLMVKEWGW